MSIISQALHSVEPAMELLDLGKANSENLPTCRVCGQPMHLLAEEEQRYYCYKDDQVWLGKERRWFDDDSQAAVEGKSGSPEQKGTSLDFKDQEMLLAAKIVNHPEIVDDIRGRYQIIMDQALVKLGFDNIDRAIKIMAEKGWKPISITALNRGPDPLGGGSTATYLYALLEGPQNTALDKQ
jgi:hypothetical protein